MTGFGTVLHNELRQYFATPIAYVLVAIFWAASGYFFSFNVFLVNAPHMVTSFHNMSILLMAIMPVLTMRLFAEERKAGTLELLLALPLGEAGIVLGKFVAALAVLYLMLLGTGVAVVPLLLFGQPDLGPIVGGYIGIFLLAAAFLAIGLFVSSLSSNQVVAAVVTWGILVLLWFIDYGAALDAGYLVTRVTRHLSFSVHYVDLIRGVIASESLVYLGGIVTAMLVASTQVLRALRA